MALVWEPIRADLLDEVTAPLWTYVTAAGAGLLVGGVIFHLLTRGDIRNLAYLAATDELTGLYNRRALQDHVTREVAAAKRYGRALSFIILDIDDFKAINNKWGYATADGVLAELGTLLKDQTRKSDIAGRYKAGDEFALVLPDTEPTPGRFVAEKIRQAVGAHQFQGRSKHGTPEGLRITISAGVFGYPKTEKDPNATKLQEEAERALNIAKGTKNTVVLAP